MDDIESTYVKELERLCLDAIKELLSFDMMNHSQHGWCHYEIEPSIKTLAQRAQSIGLTVEPPYDGYDLDQLDTPITGTSAT